MITIKTEWSLYSVGYLAYLSDHYGLLCGSNLAPPPPSQVKNL